MNRTLSTREKVLITILAFVLLAMVYYLVVWKTVNETIETSHRQTEAAQTEMMVEQAKYQQMVSMQEEIDLYNATPESRTSTVPEYDNTEPLMYALGTLMSADSTDYSMGFATVSVEGTLVRRAITMSFTCEDYARAKSIITNLKESSYRSHVGDISFAAQGGDISEMPIKVNVQVVFYEYALEGSVITEEAK